MEKIKECDIEECTNIIGMNENPIIRHNSCNHYRCIKCVISQFQLENNTFNCQKCKKEQ